MSDPCGPMRVYFAAPLFNDMERSFNARISALLEPFAEVFLPQRDGKLMLDLVADGMAPATARRMVFEADLVALKACTHVVAVLDDRTIDEGVAFEIGYAYALGKTCIGFKTDDRTLLPSGDNPMIVAGCREICVNVVELIDWLRSRSLAHRDIG